jgi:hypothetical protein
MRDVPLVPLCHEGLTPRDLPMPLSLRQGMALGDAESVRRLYSRIADVLELSVTPESSYEGLATEFAGLSMATRGDQRSLDELASDRVVRKRLHEALNHLDYAWQSLERLAATAGNSEEIAANLLRTDDEVRFSKGGRATSLSDFAPPPPSLRDRSFPAPIMPQAKAPCLGTVPDLGDAAPAARSPVADSTTTCVR